MQPRQHRQGPGHRVNTARDAGSPGGWGPSLAPHLSVWDADSSGCSHACGSSQVLLQEQARQAPSFSALNHFLPLNSKTQLKTSSLCQALLLGAQGHTVTKVVVLLSSPFMSQTQMDKTCYSLKKKKISLELFYKLNNGVATKSVEIPRTFITQTGKNEETQLKSSFLTLHRARRPAAAFPGELFGQQKSKRTPRDCEPTEAGRGESEGRL